MLGTIYAQDSLILKQQLQQLKYELQIKQKKILYFQAHIKNIKIQNGRKISFLENQLEDITKKYNQLIENDIKQRKIQFQSSDQNMKRIVLMNKSKIQENSRFYAKIIEEKQEQFNQTIKILQNRYECLIEKLKNQNKVLQNLLTSRTSSVQEQSSSNQYISISNHRKQEALNRQDLLSTRKQNQRLKDLLQDQKIKNTKLINQKKYIESELRRQKQNLNKNIESLRKKAELSQHEKREQIETLKSQVQILQAKQQNYLKKIQENENQHFTFLTHRQQNKRLRMIPIKTIKSCTHEGLISQLQRNNLLKQNQIEQLKSRISEWQKFLGFDKTCHTRLKQIQNVSEQTKTLHKNQKDRMKKQANRLNLKT